MTHRTLQRSRDPPGACLLWKIHFPISTFAPLDRGTSVHVWFAMRAENSSRVVVYQAGSHNAVQTLSGAGGGNVVVATLAYRGLGTIIPSLARVIMGWADVECTGTRVDVEATGSIGADGDA